MIAALRGRTQTDISADWLLAQGCERAIIILAETAKSLPAVVRETAPDLPWSNIVAMGNLLKHQHFETDSDVLWETLTGDFPRLHPKSWLRKTAQVAK